MLLTSPGSEDPEALLSESGLSLLISLGAAAFAVVALALTIAAVLIASRADRPRGTAALERSTR